MFRSVKRMCTQLRRAGRLYTCPLGLKQGCLASPILSSRFIDELATEIENNNMCGVQLFPALAEILLRMFADDFALISDTVIGLQRLLNLYHKFCKARDLLVKTLKTKKMLYSKWESVSKR